MEEEASLDKVAKVVEQISVESPEDATSSVTPSPTNKQGKLAIKLLENIDENKPTSDGSADTPLPPKRRSRLQSQNIDLTPTKRSKRIASYTEKMLDREPIVQITRLPSNMSIGSQSTSDKLPTTAARRSKRTISKEVSPPEEKRMVPARRASRLLSRTEETPQSISPSHHRASLKSKTSPHTGESVQAQRTGHLKSITSPKKATPAKRGSRLKSNTDAVETEDRPMTPAKHYLASASIVSEVTQSPRALRAARRNSIASEKNSIINESSAPLTPKRQTRRTRNNSSSSVENQVEELPKARTLLDEVIIEEPGAITQIGNSSQSSATPKRLFANFEKQVVAEPMDQEESNEELAVKEIIDKTPLREANSVMMNSPKVVVESPRASIRKCSIVNNTNGNSPTLGNNTVYECESLDKENTPTKNSLMEVVENFSLHKNRFAGLNKSTSAVMHVANTEKLTRTKSLTKLDQSDTSFLKKMTLSMNSGKNVNEKINNTTISVSDEEITDIPVDKNNKLAIQNDVERANVFNNIDSEMYFQNSDDQCVPVVHRTVSEEATNTQNNECEPMDVDETLPENQTLLQDSKINVCEVKSQNNNESIGKVDSFSSPQIEISNHFISPIVQTFMVHDVGLDPSKSPSQLDSKNNSKSFMEQKQNLSLEPESSSVSQNKNSSIAISESSPKRNDSHHNRTRESFLSQSTVQGRSTSEDKSTPVLSLLKDESSNTSKTGSPAKNSVSLNESNKDNRLSLNFSRNTPLNRKIKDLGIQTSTPNVNEKNGVYNKKDQESSDEEKETSDNENEASNKLSNNEKETLYNEQKDSDSEDQETSDNEKEASNKLSNNEKETLYNEQKDSDSEDQKKSDSEDQKDSDSEDQKDSDSEDQKSDDACSGFLDDQAEVSDNHYESDSNHEEIFEEGETLTSENDNLSDDSEYEKGSFVVSSDEDDYELLSGSGDDLDMSDNELTINSKSKKKYNERKDKERRQASREMFESRHSLNTSDGKEIKKKSRRQRIESTADSSDDKEKVNSTLDTTNKEEGKKCKKPNRMRLDSTFEAESDENPDLHESTVGNKSGNKEKEISIIEENNSAEKDPLNNSKINTETGTPSKGIDYINFTVREDIENMDVDANMSLQINNEPNDDPLEYNDESLSENDEVIENYNNIINKLNKIQNEEKIKDSNISLNKTRKHSLSKTVETSSDTSPKIVKHHTSVYEHVEETTIEEDSETIKKSKKKKNRSQETEEIFESLNSSQSKIKRHSLSENLESTTTITLKSKKHNTSAPENVIGVSESIKKSKKKKNRSYEATESIENLNVSLNKTKKRSLSEIVESVVSDRTQQEAQEHNTNTNENINEDHDITKKSKKKKRKCKEDISDVTGLSLTDDSLVKSKKKKTSMQEPQESHLGDEATTTDSDALAVKRKKRRRKNKNKGASNLVQDDSPFAGDRENPMSQDDEDEPNVPVDKEKHSPKQQPEVMATNESSAGKIKSKKKKRKHVSSDDFSENSCIENNEVALTNEGSSEKKKKNKRKHSNSDSLMTEDQGSEAKRRKMIAKGDDVQQMVRRLPTAVIEQLGNKKPKNKAISTTKFKIAKKSVYKNTPSLYLEQSVCMDQATAKHVSAKSNKIYPKVLPSLPTTAKVSATGFTTHFKTCTLTESDIHSLSDMQSIRIKGTSLIPRIPSANLINKYQKSNKLSKF